MHFFGPPHHKRSHYACSCSENKKDGELKHFCHQSARPTNSARFASYSLVVFNVYLLRQAACGLKISTSQKTFSYINNMAMVYQSLSNTIFHLNGQWECDAIATSSISYTQRGFVRTWQSTPIWLEKCDNDIRQEIFVLSHRTNLCLISVDAPLRTHTNLFRE